MHTVHPTTVNNLDLTTVILNGAKSRSHKWALESTLDLAHYWSQLLLYKTNRKYQVHQFAQTLKGLLDQVLSSRCSKFSQLLANRHTHRKVQLSDFIRRWNKQNGNLTSSHLGSKLQETDVSRAHNSPNLRHQTQINTDIHWFNLSKGVFDQCFAAVEMTSVCQSGIDDNVSANKAAVRVGDHSGEKHVADPRDLETNVVFTQPTLFHKFALLWLLYLSVDK